MTERLQPFDILPQIMAILALTTGLWTMLLLWAFEGWRPPWRWMGKLALFGMTVVITSQSQTGPTYAQAQMENLSNRTDRLETGLMNVQEVVAGQSKLLTQQEILNRSIEKMLDETRESNKIQAEKLIQVEMSQQQMHTQWWTIIGVLGVVGAILTFLVGVGNFLIVLVSTAFGFWVRHISKKVDLQNGGHKA